MTLDERQAVTALLEAQEWRFARTMPDNPHWYTLRKTWKKDEDFVRVVLYIRTQGHLEWWPSVEDGYPYVYLDLGGYHYWSMPGRLAGQVLINRKPLA
jgi:hypothetical protein